MEVESEHEMELEDMEGVEEVQEDEEDEEDEELAFRVQKMCEYHQVPLAFHAELHRLLFDRSTSTLARRLDRDRTTHKPSMDILVASAVAEMKNQLSFQVTKHFGVFRAAAGDLRARTLLRVLNIRLDGPVLHYQSLASAWRGSFAKQLTRCDDRCDHPKGGGAFSRVDDRLKESMQNVLCYDQKCTVPDNNWSLKVADGLMEIAERAVFGDEEHEQLGEQMRVEVAEYGNGVKLQRDRFAHVFECSMQLTPNASEEFFRDNPVPPTKKMSEGGCALFKTMMQHVESGMQHGSRYRRGYDQAQWLLYDSCIARVKRLHLPLVEQFEDRKRMLSG